MIFYIAATETDVVATDDIIPEQVDAELVTILREEDGRDLFTSMENLEQAQAQASNTPQVSIRNSEPPVSSWHESAAGAVMSSTARGQGGVFRRIRRERYTAERNVLHRREREAKEACRRHRCLGRAASAAKAGYDKYRDAYLKTKYGATNLAAFKQALTRQKQMFKQTQNKIKAVAQQQQFQRRKIVATVIIAGVRDSRFRDSNSLQRAFKAAFSQMIGVHRSDIVITDVGGAPPGYPSLIPTMGSSTEDLVQEPVQQQEPWYTSASTAVQSAGAAHQGAGRVPGQSEVTFEIRTDQENEKLTLQVLQSVLVDASKTGLTAAFENAAKAEGDLITANIEQSSPPAIEFVAPAAVMGVALPPPPLPQSLPPQPPVKKQHGRQEANVTSALRKVKKHEEQNSKALKHEKESEERDNKKAKNMEEKKDKSALKDVNKHEEQDRKALEHQKVSEKKDEKEANKMEKKGKERTGSANYKSWPAWNSSFTNSSGLAGTSTPSPPPTTPSPQPIHSIHSASHSKHVNHTAVSSSHHKSGGIGWWWLFIVFIMSIVAYLFWYFVLKKRGLHSNVPDEAYLEQEKARVHQEMRQSMDGFLARVMEDSEMMQQALNEKQPVVAVIPMREKLHQDVVEAGRLQQALLSHGMDQEAAQVSQHAADLERLANAPDTGPRPPAEQDIALSQALTSKNHELLRIAVQDAELQIAQGKITLPTQLATARKTLQSMDKAEKHGGYVGCRATRGCEDSLRGRKRLDPDAQNHLEHSLLATMPSQGCCAPKGPRQNYASLPPSAPRGPREIR